MTKKDFVSRRRMLLTALQRNAEIVIGVVTGLSDRRRAASGPRIRERGPEFGDSLEEVQVRVEEETKPGRETRSRPGRAPLNQLQHTEAIRQGVRQSCAAVRTRFAV